MKKILHDIDYIEKTLFWKQIGKKKEDGSFRNGEIADYISGFLKEIEKHQQDSNETVEASAISGKHRNIAIDPYTLKTEILKWTKGRNIEMGP